MMCSFKNGLLKNKIDLIKGHPDAFKSTMREAKSRDISALTQTNHNTALPEDKRLSLNGAGWMGVSDALWLGASGK